MEQEFWPVFKARPWKWNKNHVSGTVGKYNNKRIAITFNLLAKFAVKFDAIVNRAITKLLENYNT